jgi:hypothetical protein
MLCGTFQCLVSKNDSGGQVKHLLSRGFFAEDESGCSMSIKKVCARESV